MKRSYSSFRDYTEHDESQPENFSLRRLWILIAVCVVALVSLAWLHPLVGAVIGIACSVGVLVSVGWWTLQDWRRS